MRRELVTKSTSGGCGQFETSPEVIEPEIRTALCERRQTDRLKTNYRIDVVFGPLVFHESCAKVVMLFACQQPPLALVAAKWVWARGVCTVYPSHEPEGCVQPVGEMEAGDLYWSLSRLECLNYWSLTTSSKHCLHCWQQRHPFLGRMGVAVCCTCNMPTNSGQVHSWYLGEGLRTIARQDRLTVMYLSSHLCPTHTSTQLKPRPKHGVSSLVIVCWQVGWVVSPTCRIFPEGER